ncbi:MAG: cysteine--tRNA ligase [Candidatus Paceibacterota bacterium]|jgi:cysteinyl-tRNA synthetase
MRLLNTLSGKKEEVMKPEGRPLNFFVCGPTVYDYAHIGHARTYIAFDLLVRYLRASGFNVFYLQNITDVDDRIIVRAKERSITPQTLAEEFETAHKEDMTSIGITSASAFARASDYIPDIVRQVEALITKGNAYKIEHDGFYFDISTFPDYGKLSKRTVAQAEDAVTRIDEGVQKRNRGDFALWKFVVVPTNTSEKQFTLVDGEPAWNTSLGWGRPGWHIEDTAITEHFFGPQYDIHGGAEDLKFPHHEAEIAQQEAASGKKPFVRIWLHTGFVRVGGEKMSKSLGNFLTIRDFLKKNTVETLRWLVASHHYRSPINYTDETLTAATRSLDTLYEFLDKLSFIEGLNSKNNSVSYEKIEGLIMDTKAKVTAALEDDFNTPEAIGVLFNFLNEIKPKLWMLEQKAAKEAMTPLLDVLSLFGIEYTHNLIPSEIIAFAEERELYRVNKQFANADDLRKKISALGYSVDDTPLGPFVRKMPTERR